ncbi:MAG: putative transport system ATP-binding protein [Solirubrobacterales bacterium]|nr:putative transport system ATP-binding protein [Solirubrobacterales bacterium]
MPLLDDITGAVRGGIGRAGEALIALGRNGDRPELEAAEPPKPPAPVVLAAKDLAKVYGEGSTAVHALDGASIEVRKGEIVAIMGPSGSGKSTMLHLLGALETPSAGQISLGGERYDGLDDAGLTRIRRDRIGFVFQFFNLLPSLTAEENVLLPALIAGESGDRVRSRSRELLGVVGLADRVSHLPSELSGGEQQRVSIARALLREPELILADEPTGNLDSRSSAEILALLRDLSDSQDQTVVMVTHDPGAAAIADRVVFLRDGQVAGEEAGGSRELISAAFTALQA